MSLLIECTCGRRLKARDEHIGRKVRCPACGAAVAVLAANAEAPASGVVHAAVAVAPPPARRAAAAPVGRPIIVPGHVARAPNRPHRGEGALAGLLHLSTGMKALIATAIIIPTILYLSTQGPVKAVREWTAAQKTGADDASGVVARVIRDLDKALMPPPMPDVEGAGIPYHPQVLKFYWVDPPTFVWRMPSVVAFKGETTFGPFEGTYRTRTRECQGLMTYKWGMVTFKGSCTDQSTQAEVNGIKTSDKAAIEQADANGSLWSKDTIEEGKIRVIVP
jgi:hypothetical protein